MGVVLMSHIKMDLVRNDGMVLMVVYPFTSDEEMVEFKNNCDRIFSGVYCDDCERVDPEDIDPSDFRDESRD
jgi:hypothetical protein